MNDSILYTLLSLLLTGTIISVIILIFIFRVLNLAILEQQGLGKSECVHKQY